MQILKKERNIKIFDLYLKGISTLELAKMFDISKQRIAFIINESQARGLVESLKDSGVVRSKKASGPYKKPLFTLTEREHKILSMRYGLYDGIKYTLQDIGNESGVTRERIRQIEEEALKKINKNTIMRKGIDLSTLELIDSIND